MEVINIKKTLIAYKKNNKKATFTKNLTKHHIFTSIQSSVSSNSVYSGFCDLETDSAILFTFIPNISYSLTQKAFYTPAPLLAQYISFAQAHKRTRPYAHIIHDQQQLAL